MNASRTSLLFCAHPGHELRVQGWLEREKPAVCYLTDGSGADGVSRLPRSLELIAHAGASFNDSFGTATDRDVYQALLQSDFAFFEERANRLTAIVADNGYTLVAGDAAEGYNPSHDVARMLINAAAARSGNGPLNVAFPLVGDPQQPPPGCGPASSIVELDGRALQEKIDRGRAYALDSGGILVSEVDEAIERFGLDAFRVERLFSVNRAPESFAAFEHEKPFYESYGEKQVAQGKYDYVIRWNEHVRPVAERLGQVASSTVL